MLLTCLQHLKRKSLQVNDQTPPSAEAKLSPTESDFEIPNIVRSEDAVLIQDEIFEALVMDDVEAEQRGEPIFDVLVRIFPPLNWDFYSEFIHVFLFTTVSILFSVSL